MIRYAPAPCPEAERSGSVRSPKRNMKGSSRTLVYSPTINTTDANGLEAVLMNDKRRLEKLLKDREMRDEAEVYA